MEEHRAAKEKMEREMKEMKEKMQKMEREKREAERRVKEGKKKGEEIPSLPPRKNTAKNNAPTDNAGTVSKIILSFATAPEIIIIIDFTM